MKEAGKARLNHVAIFVSDLDRNIEFYEKLDVSDPAQSTGCRFPPPWLSAPGRPTSIVLLPAVVLLVSGSIGFRGLASIATGNVVVGEQQFLQMFVVALTIFAGILVGYTIVRPEPTL